MVPADHADQPPVALDYGEQVLAMLLLLFLGGVDQIARLLERRIGGSATTLVRITSRTNRISSGSSAYSRLRVIAAARDLLGQYRALQRQHRESVRQNAADEQGQQHVEVVRQFERENNAGKRRAHGAAQNGAHADQRPEARPTAAGTCLQCRPSAPPIISSGASTPPEVPEPSEITQIDRLHQQDAGR